ncbi:ribonuclease HII [Bifidobacterium sp. MA2]|uniref:Ribonuclease n=1 Tax=Bifidobacterium santillanense TaxID=2809028 RepID=A0ABS5UQT4_9BIFI|nr:ribonuclease HII [Bifidobacterium santillanense]MBT1173215.1 ribonuclease HII [Bifidobacterium santillanense]
MITPTLDMERDLAAQGYDLVCGFDEVGRGALAGPVMVGCAAVWSRDLLGADFGTASDSMPSTRSASTVDSPSTSDSAVRRAPLAVPAGVADSKLLTEHRREAIYDELTEWCAAYAVGSASNAEIDEWGITYALGVAALRALAEVERKLGLTTPPGGERPDRPIRVGAILDGPSDYITKAMNTFDAPDVPIPAHVVTKVKGDRHCAVVATAAVIAKVTRDHLMTELAASDPKYAPYEWERNKGYGTETHRAAIFAQGPSDLHRLSWKLV